VEHGLTPAVAFTGGVCPALDATAARMGRQLAFHLKDRFGYGGGLGTTRHPPDRFKRRCGDSVMRALDGLMTHFASAADFESKQTEAQIAYFNGIAETLAAGGDFAGPICISRARTRIAYPRGSANAGSLAGDGPARDTAILRVCVAGTGQSFRVVC